MCISGKLKLPRKYLDTPAACKISCGASHRGKGSYATATDSSNASYDYC